MILTLPVLLYQLLFDLIMYVASRLGHRTMVVALVACLIWTATHLLFLPLMAMQAVVIVSSYLLFRTKNKTTR